MPTIIVKSDEGQEVGIVPLTAKTFSTGSRGYHGFGKVQIGEKRFQCNFILVEIGSKPGSKPAAPAAQTKRGRAK